MKLWAPLSYSTEVHIALRPESRFAVLGGEITVLFRAVPGARLYHPLKGEGVGNLVARFWAC